MEVTINVKVNIKTSNPHATPHRMGEVLKYGIETIPSDADYKVVDWTLEEIKPDNLDR